MTEEIKIITEAMQLLSGTALWAFIMYLIVGKLLITLICWAGEITVLCIVGKRISNIVDSVSRSVNIAKHIRDSLNIGSPGCLYQSELDKVAAAVPKLVSSYKKGETK